MRQSMTSFASSVVVKEVAPCASSSFSALSGLVAQLIDGSLGMAYGVTSSTLLLAAGVAPAAASAAVHFSEIGTSLVSGASHHKLGNVDWRTVVDPRACPASSAPSSAPRCCPTWTPRSPSRSSR